VVGFEIATRLAAAVEKENTTVRPFDGFLFLCGGALEASESALASARSYALSRTDAQGRIAGHRVILAERMTSLLQGDDFHDLLEFEEHIAALSACVLIFVESPGSIAELGSFSVMRHLAPKLLVVCEQRFESPLAPSFIFLGPIASLRRNRQESVQIFPISSETATGFEPSRALLDDCWEYIEEAVIASLKRPIPESALDPKELSHQMVLIATLIGISAAVRIHELEELLNLFDVNISLKALRRILRMLEQFELISSKTYGNDKFYHAQLDHPLIAFRSADSSIVFDPVRFKADAISFYQEEDVRKFKAIKAHQKSVRPS
jgi:hypothetical protein